MIGNLPTFITWVFILTTTATVGFYLYAVWENGRRTIALLTTAAILTALLAVHAALACNGFYFVKTMPPRFALAPFPSIVILLIVFRAFTTRIGVSNKSLRILTLLSVIRVPVELVLLWLFQAGQVPELMTFEGRNFDIVSGLSAPVVAWLAFRGGTVNRPLLIAWNFVALGLLLNIITIAVLSLETAFQKLAFDQPNRAVLYFPFIWLPAIVVPVVFVSHVVSLRQLLKRAQ